MTGKRVCLLTGASGPLGRHFIHRYRDRYDIVAVYRTNRPWFTAQDVRVVDPLAPAAALDENRHPIFAVRADLRRPAAARRIVETALTRFEHVDLVVNAAAATVWGGVLASPRLVDSAADQFNLAIEAPLRLTTALAELSWQRDTAANRSANRNIVNVSSVAGLRVYRGLGQSVYGATKAAMNQLTAHLADELAPLGVRVNAMAANSFPQIVATERAADAIRALDESDVTGCIRIVDGPADNTLSLADMFELAPS